MDAVEVATATGKFRRTVHLGYDMALGDPDSIDLDLTPNEGDRLTLLTFVDSADGEMNVYVLNEDYRQRLVAALTGGVYVPPGLPGLNGRGG